MQNQGLFVEIPLPDRYTSGQCRAHECGGVFFFFAVGVYIQMLYIYTSSFLEIEK